MTTRTEYQDRTNVLEIVLRYIHFYIYFLRFSFTKALHFRVDFLFRIVMDCLFYLSSFGVFGLITMDSGALGAWNREQIFLFVSTFILMDAIEMTIFSTNMYFLPFAINKGDLDYYLLRPVNSLFFLLFKEFAVNSFFNLLLTIIIAFYSISNSSLLQPGWITIFSYLVGISSGVILATCVGLLISVIPVFWTQGGNSLQQLYFQMGHLSEHPIVIYRGWVKRFLTFILPLGIVSSIPAQILWEGPKWTNLGLLGTLTVIFVILTGSLWKLGLKNYSSASS